MRLFEPQDLESSLEKAGCHKTSQTSLTASYWKAENGTLFSVPNPDEVSGMYSDFMYFRLVRFANNNRK